MTVTSLRVYFTPPLLAVLMLGFASGLPLALTASTLSVWLTEAGVSKAAIGIFAAVATPYSLKFLWAPVVDALPFPLLSRLLGRRRGWLIGVQLLLMAALVFMGLADPAADAWVTAYFALAVAFLSATQDIVIDAYRVELLPVEEQGNGAAMSVLGYRFGMIASSAGALYLATWHGWEVTYAVMGMLLGVGMLAAWWAGEPKEGIGYRVEGGGRKFLKEGVVAPLVDFMTRPQWALILLFIFLYKFGDAFIGLMTNPFLLELGFAKTDIAAIVKLYGLIATIAGGFIGGWMVERYGLLKPLWFCGIAQAATNLVFILQAQAGADSGMLAVTITMDNLSGGMGTAAFVAYLSSLCNLRFTATQYALLSSLASVGRTIFSTPAGWLAEAIGWEWFFLSSALLALPGLAALYCLTRKEKSS